MLVLHRNSVHVAGLRHRPTPEPVDGAVPDQSAWVHLEEGQKLLGKACPVRRMQFVQPLREFLIQAQQHDSPLLVFSDEAHLHLDTDLGWGWAPRGQRLLRELDLAVSGQKAHLRWFLHSGSCGKRCARGPRTGPTPRRLSRCSAPCETAIQTADWY